MDTKPKTVVHAGGWKQAYMAGAMLALALLWAALLGSTLHTFGHPYSSSSSTSTATSGSSDDLLERLAFTARVVIG